VSKLKKVLNLYLFVNYFYWTDALAGTLLTNIMYFARLRKKVASDVLLLKQLQIVPLKIEQ